jgi:transcriptional regulator with XRE-family HTH domain
MSTARALLSCNLRRLRAAAGLSQQRLAASAGVDRSYISDLERQAENPSIDSLDRLARALAVPMAEFFAPSRPAAPAYGLSGRGPGLAAGGPAQKNAAVVNE